MMKTKAEKKLKHMGDREVGGYITPADAAELIKLGYRPTSNIDWFMERGKSGVSNPTWIYFTTNKVQ